VAAVRESQRCAEICLELVDELEAAAKGESARLGEHVVAKNGVSSCREGE